MSGLINSPSGGGLLSIPTLQFRINKSVNGEFYWTLHSIAGNKEAIAQSETYTTKQSCQHSIGRIKQSAASAEIEDKTL